MLLVASLLLILVSGWGLGRTRKDLNLLTFALTLFGAITAHSSLQWAFIDARLDSVVGDPRKGASEAVIVLIAAFEAAGLWVPIIAIPWARFPARLYGGLYALASSVVAAVYHYFPFDLPVISKDLISPFGPPYLVAVFACLPLAAVAYLFGWMKSVNEQADERADRPLE